MHMRFATEHDAAFALLKESTAVLKDCGVDFVIVGGWVPFLFHAKRFGHPGTYDVDVLLNSKTLNDGSFSKAAERLLEEGYPRAVKNKFQAHRIIRVANESLVFHVDFLNEQEPADELEFVGGVGKLHSIYTPAMKAVFVYGGYRTHATLPGIRFPSVETFVASKAAATLVKKRRRDAFDVFISVADEDRVSFQSRWRALLHDGLFRDANDALWKAINEEDAIAKIMSVVHDISPNTRISGEDIGATFNFLAEPEHMDGQK